MDRTAHAGSSRTVGTLVVLGDSVGVGLGDPVPDRGWRGHRIGVVDLAGLPGIYRGTAWSVDRLHPSELGHRTLANAFAGLIADAGIAVGEVSLTCGGGLVVTRTQRVAWLIAKGIPWL